MRSLSVSQLYYNAFVDSGVVAYTRLEPIDKLDNMWVLQPLEHVELVVNHLLVAFDILFQDDLDGHLARRTVCLTNNSIGARAKCPTESVFGSVAKEEEQR